MISTTNPGSHYTEYHGLSTDTKPINNVVNGSVFFEMDTSKAFMFDADSKTWREI